MVIKTEDSPQSARSPPKEPEPASPTSPTSPKPVRKMRLPPTFDVEVLERKVRETLLDDDIDRAFEALMDLQVDASLLGAPYLTAKMRSSALNMRSKYIHEYLYQMKFKFQIMCSDGVPKCLKNTVLLLVLYNTSAEAGGMHVRSAKRMFPPKNASSPTATNSSSFPVASCRVYRAA